MHRRIFLAALFLTCALGALVTYSISPTTREVPDETIASLRECIQDPDTVVGCSTKLIDTLLTQLNTEETMAVLNESVDPFSCHTLGHIVGQQTYHNTGNLEDAISLCSVACDNSCLHGAVSQSIVEETNIEVSSDGTVHLNLPLIQAESEKLCARRSVCHGVGHILYQVFNDVGRALAQCDESADGSPREFCYWGVFMENADVISTGNIILGTKRVQLWDANDPLYPCNAVEEKYRHACYRYQPRIQSRIWNGTVSPEEKLARRTELCATLNPTDRASCFEGIGFSLYRDLIRTPEVVRHACERLPHTADRAACMLGAVHPVSRFGYPDTALRFCAATIGSFERSICYHAVFESIVYSVISERMPRFTVRPILTYHCIRYGETGCSIELNDYLGDKWETVFGLPNSLLAPETETFTTNAQAHTKPRE